MERLDVYRKNISMPGGISCRRGIPCRLGIPCCVGYRAGVGSIAMSTFAPACWRWLCRYAQRPHGRAWLYEWARSQHATMGAFHQVRAEQTAPTDWRDWRAQPTTKTKRESKEPDDGAARRSGRGCRSRVDGARLGHIAARTGLSSRFTLVTEKETIAIGRWRSRTCSRSPACTFSCRALRSVCARCLTRPPLPSPHLRRDWAASAPGPTSVHRAVHGCAAPA